MNVKQIIDGLGGCTEVAGMCEVTKGAVSQWCSANHIPKSRLKYLKLLRPDVFNAQPKDAGESPIQESGNPSIKASGNSVVEVGQPAKSDGVAK